MKVKVQTPDPASKWSETHGQHTYYLFWCPGCETSHMINDTWGFNGNIDSPTFTPSVLVHMTKWDGTVEQYGNWTRPTHPNVEPGGQCVCHSFVTDGTIQFLTDSTHTLAGQTVPLPDWIDD